MFSTLLKNPKNKFFKLLSYVCFIDIYERHIGQKNIHYICNFFFSSFLSYLFFCVWFSSFFSAHFGQYKKRKEIRKNEYEGGEYICTNNRTLSICTIKIYIYIYVGTMCTHSFYCWKRKINNSNNDVGWLLRRYS